MDNLNHLLGRIILSLTITFSIIFWSIIIDCLGVGTLFGKIVGGQSRILLTLVCIQYPYSSSNLLRLARFKINIELVVVVV